MGNALRDSLDGDRIRVGEARSASGTSYPHGIHLTMNFATFCFTNGVVSNSAPRQVTEEELSRMSPEQIVEAQDKGLLKNLLGG